MKKTSTLILILLNILVVSCRKESAIIDGNTNTDDVTFSVTLPGQGSGIKTYALSDVEENELKTVDVFAFKVNTDESETFAYKVQATQITTPDGMHPANKTFKAPIIKGGTQKYRFVLLANVRYLCDTVTININEEKAHLLEKLVGVHEDFDGKWNVDPANYTPLPMWGESDKIVIDESTNSISGLNLLRSVARVDVLLSGAAITNFKITSIILYNNKYSGLIAPREENYDPAEKKVTVVSIPSHSDPHFIPVIYAIPEPGLELMNTIYTFEAAAKPAASNDATGLVIGGKYNGSSTETFYRIDFLDNNATPLAILRNHKYTINIAKVGGPGYSSKEIAWASKPVNMEVNITPFDEGGITKIVFDGQYALGIDKDNFSLPYLPSSNNQIKAFTDYTTGWKASTSDSWITINTSTGGSGEQGVCTFSLAAHRNDQVARTGQIILKAGRLSKIINVIQAGSPPPPAAGTFMDLGLSFYVYKTDLPAGFNWYTYSNVTNVTIGPSDFTDDASLHQATPVKANSCASLGSDWRLPTISELEELIPGGSNPSLPTKVTARDAIQAAITSAGGTELGGFWYFSSSSLNKTTPAFIHQNGSTFNANWYTKSTISAVDINLREISARCVYSK